MSTDSHSLDERRGLQGLTSKQYQFATLVYRGASQVAAYRQVYDCEGMTETTISKRASDVALHPLVTAKLRELRLETDRQSTLAPTLSRQFVTDGLMQLATASTKDSVRLGAYIALGKTVGIDLFRETIVRETRTRTIEDVDRELHERLSELAPMIEGAAVERKQPSEPAASPDRRRKPRG